MGKWNMIHKKPITFRMCRIFSNYFPWLIILQYIFFCFDNICRDHFLILVEKSIGFRIPFQQLNIVEACHLFAFYVETSAFTKTHLTWIHLFLASFWILFRYCSSSSASSLSPWMVKTKHSHSIERSKASKREWNNSDTIVKIQTINAD